MLSVMVARFESSSPSFRACSSHDVPDRPRVGEPLSEDELASEDEELDTLSSSESSIVSLR